MVKRKILVLDLDETLIHSHHDGVIRQMVKPGTPPDFVLKVIISFSSETIKIYDFTIFRSIRVFYIILPLINNLIIQAFKNISFEYLFLTPLH